ncbi:MAG: hypothetical protein GY944_00220 [bacterium]|nr:hypothetical protein [bacterium]MCP5039417.1 hypothetical protein [bacterium]
MVRERIIERAGAASLDMTCMAPVRPHRAALLHLSGAKRAMRHPDFPVWPTNTITFVVTTKTDSETT